MRRSTEAAFARPASEFTKNGTLPDGNDAIPAQDGMTLRDYFAAQAIMGSCAATNPWWEDYKELAQAAYHLADAMLAQREK